MHTLEDEKVIQEYENYIEKNGTDDEVLSKYIKAIEIVIVGREDREYGLKISSRVKKLIEKVVFDNSDGGTIWQLEKYQQDNDTLPYDLVEKYYEIQKYESFYLFESFIYYMERNRSYSKRFYQPRRQTLKCVVDDLQALEDKEQNRVFYVL